MASEETFDAEEFLRSMTPTMARIGRPLDLEILDQRLHRASTPRFVSPERFRTPTPSDQATPPFSDSEQVRQGFLALESDSRRALEEQGCPPCCPPNFEWPYEGDLGEYEGIVNWWKSKDEHVLSAQLEDWKRFCLWRRECRRQPFTQDDFHAYVGRLSERRAQFGLEGEVKLEFQIEDQTLLQTWIEFQDYHHRLLAILKENNGRKEMIEGRKTFLRWIEEQRKIMAAQERENESQPTTEHAAWVDYAISRLVRKGNTVSLPDDFERTVEQMNELAARLR
ncbi:hypothetical protein IWX90DRAFT_4012 [Phyllosticta citrichinensis]|uniref:Uncharacterized protein n=1 Tax=Phyllosticta citrichinensis TaxID=1130410 RepID=A0ABR1Y5S4_9PEZI